jgi:hypothetical protein
MAPLLALTVIVYTSNLAAAPAAVVRDAQARVTQLFADAGVIVEWQDDVPHGVHAEARLVIASRPGGSFRNTFDTVLGAASPSSSPHGTGTAWVFFDRIAEHSERHAVPLSRLLACAIAHELGHVLQVRPGHSDRGVMRATWRKAEYRSAAIDRLLFTAADAAAFSRTVRLWPAGDSRDAPRGADQQAVAVNRR